MFLRAHFAIFCAWQWSLFFFVLNFRTSWYHRMLSFNVAFAFGDKLARFVHRLITKKKKNKTFTQPVLHSIKKLTTAPKSRFKPAKFPNQRLPNRTRPKSLFTFHTFHHCRVVRFRRIFITFFSNPRVVFSIFYNSFRGRWNSNFFGAPKSSGHRRCHIKYINAFLLCFVLFCFSSTFLNTAPIGFSSAPIPKSRKSLA